MAGFQYEVIVMEEDQKVMGYRELSQVEIDRINLIKSQAEEVKKLMKGLEEWGEPDGRWLAIANTDLQKGFMSAVRSIAKPETY